MEKKGNILVNKYELGRLLGQGNFAKVYHGRNMQTGENVAIKVIDKGKIVKVGLSDHIKREISVMKLCQHPNVVALYEVVASKSKIYLVMEYLKGGELFAKVAKGRLKEDLARKYFQQLIAAIDFCHSRGVYHRDLKPENLLLDESGNMKVMDFGLSALTESRRQDGLLHTACGTPAYVAPEVIKRKGYDGGRADIWSCGVILFVLLAGYLPFSDPNIMELYRKIARGDIRYPQWFPQEVRKLLRKILDPNPSTRMTVAELMENNWFKMGFKQYNPSQIVSDLSLESPRSVLDCQENSDEWYENQKPEGETNENSMKPTCLNAFDIISRSSSFDLSGFFEKDMNLKSEMQFTVKKPASTIVLMLEKLAFMHKYKIMKRYGLVKLQSGTEGRKGQLAIDAEILEITPSVHVIEVKKTAGDTLEYIKFCDQELRPSLKDLI
ncbi:hypothetical protein LIER_18353 [Lithospermum erythrorhizon]|uniref:non-specific serine/threonine protein kinase n=1 Tax=Lithospermum erythrorhizon TaxID=34254 RepID=A0AAV3QG18_LITER